MCLLPEIVTKIKATTPKWRRQFKSPPKPRLPRKIISSAKVNLNRYWAKFEDILEGPQLTISQTMLAQTDNEINENLANELSLI